MYNVYEMDGTLEKINEAKGLEGRLLVDEEFHVEGRLIEFPNDTEHYVQGKFYIIGQNQGTILELSEVFIDNNVKNIPKYYLLEKQGDVEIFGKYTGVRVNKKVIIDENESKENIEVRLLRFINELSKPINRSAERVMIDLYFYS